MNIKKVLAVFLGDNTRFSLILQTVLNDRYFHYFVFTSEEVEV